MWILLNPESGSYRRLFALKKLISQGCLYTKYKFDLVICSVHHLLPYR